MKHICGKDGRNLPSETERQEKFHLALFQQLPCTIDFRLANLFLIELMLRYPIKTFFGFVLPSSRTLFKHGAPDASSLSMESEITLETDDASRIGLSTHRSSNVSRISMNN